MGNPRRLLLRLLLTLMLSISSAVAVDSRNFTRVVELLNAQSGQVIADVGAGNGDWSFSLSEIVGTEGHVYATEIDEKKVRKIETGAEGNTLTNITAILGTQNETGLPESACNAILLRLVYHHFEEPALMIEDLNRAMKLEGLIAVIDFTPENQLPRKDLPEIRDGHGVEPQTVVEEMESGGFALVERIDRWDNRDNRFLLLFRKVSAFGE